MHAAENAGLGPARADLRGENVNLFGGEHAASGLAEGGHGRAFNAVGDHFAESVLIHDCEIDRIGKGDGRAAAAVCAVATGAVFGEERVEVENFIRRNSF